VGRTFSAARAALPFWPQMQSELERKRKQINKAPRKPRGFQTKNK